MKMTKELFQNQFETQVIDVDTIINILRFDGIMFGIPVYRALEKLVIKKDDGKYYIHI